MQYGGLETSPLSTIHVCERSTGRIERECRAIGTEKLKLAFQPIGTIRRSLVQVKNRILPEKKKGIVHKIQCGECQQVYVAVASPGGFQGFLETSQAPTIAYSTVQLARYSLGATDTELSL